MKKYHQLLLLIVSIISLSLFLIYRHEYNRLHYVLEVFNFFGQPCNFSDLQKTDIILNQHDWGPQPFWQETDNGYVYSAFLTGKIEIKAIALQSGIKNIPRNCYLWFEDKKKAIPGKFKLSKLIVNLSNRLAIQASFLPWNYPKGESSLIRSIVENDCLLRTFGQTKYVITLEINEYIVPTNAVGFDSLVKDFGEDFHRLSLPVQKFCINNLSMNKPIALQNFEVANDFNYNVVRYIRRNTKNNDLISTNAVDKAHASIHKYVRCNLDPHKTTTDNSMLTFSTDFTRSTLVQLLMHDQL
ncbi:hypothetical protein NQ314_016739 [Rhamnusium bicolor]|uniref:Uncharacterized protein n=1 Tax=Rhamnusium bicolor TaxID=1586634 RepID=A0AAV8WW35_9CUCU|nr:hypothetical protein NQ314_016739 [Rhamnusium bicolor]